MVLPAPPYTVSRAFVRRTRRVIASVYGIGLAWLALCGWIAVSQAAGNLRDRRIWQRGVLTAAEVEGTVKTSRLIFNRYELQVRFLDAENKRRGGPVEFETFIGYPDTSAGPSVRYLQSDPAAFAVSWGQDALPYRWAMVVFFAAAGLGFAGALFYVPVRSVRELRVARACSKDATEVELTVTAARPDAQLVRYQLEGRSPWGQPLKQKFVADPMLGGALFLDAGKTKILGLVSPAEPDRAVVVRDTLLPFEFTPVEIEGIRERLRKL